MDKHILIADDDESVVWVLSKLFEEKGFTTTTTDNGKDASLILKNDSPDLAFLDINMPKLDGLSVLKSVKTDTPVIIMTAEGTMTNTIEAMKNGAFDYLNKPFELDEVEIIAERALIANKLSGEVTKLKEQIKQGMAKEAEFIGKSKVMTKVYKTIGKVAPSDATVLVCGESGTGKELISRIIHLNSSRSTGALITVNSAAVPKDLMESELFGSEKGAFTGASERRKGKFELADGGTLFLDEIGDMDISLQSKLLRVIQEGEFYRVGGTESVKVSVRIIAATNKDLAVEVREGRFREDLYFRLNVVELHIPPLRERRSDIVPLINHFLSKFALENRTDVKRMSKGALKVLSDYRWPGNVRELENTLKRTTLLSSGALIAPDDIQLTYSNKNTDNIEDIITKKLEPFIERSSTSSRQELYDTIMPYMERPLIKLVLKKTAYNQVKASEMLGINRNTLRKKIKELKINLKDYKE